jgi:hypothetical protein
VFTAVCSCKQGNEDDALAPGSPASGLPAPWKVSQQQQQHAATADDTLQAHMRTLVNNKCMSSGFQQVTCQHHGRRASSCESASSCVSI